MIAIGVDGLIHQEQPKKNFYCLNFIHHTTGFYFSLSVEVEFELRQTWRDTMRLRWDWKRSIFFVFIWICDRRLFTIINNSYLFLLREKESDSLTLVYGMEHRAHPSLIYTYIFSLCILPMVWNNKINDLNWTFHSFRSSTPNNNHQQQQLTKGKGGKIGVLGNR